MIENDGCPEMKAITMLGKSNKILQDNTSTLQLAKNGKKSCLKQTQHVKIRYFYVSEEVEQGNIQILYCPTKEQFSDFRTKPLQGTLFQTHQNAIMGITLGDMVEYQRQYQQLKTQHT